MTLFSLLTPEEVSISLALRAKELRLAKKWKQRTLAERSGVTEASLKRFEQSGKVSLENFLKIAFALGRIEEMSSLLKPAKAGSIRDLEALEHTKSRRGSI